MSVSKNKTQTYLISENYEKTQDIKIKILFAIAVNSLRSK